jgi:hypothetical protein
VKLKRTKSGSDGFVLPLAIGVALLLLLSSLSLQTLALQSHGLAAASERLRRVEDDLSSAAHDLVGELNEGHRCLLGAALAAWDPEAAVCPAPANLTDPRSLNTPPVAYRLIAWTPAASGTAAELLLEPPAAAGQPARRAAFVVALAGGGGGALQAVAVRPLGLRGMEQ